MAGTDGMSTEDHRVVLAGADGTPPRTQTALADDHWIPTPEVRAEIDRARQALIADAQAAPEEFECESCPLPLPDDHWIYHRYAGPLDEATWREWSNARTLPDLAALTARWLTGDLNGHPSYDGPADDLEEDNGPGLTAAVIALNRAGVLTTGSQAGCDGPNHDGTSHWRQHAVVEGFAATAAGLARLTGPLAAAGYRLAAWLPADEDASPVEYGTDRIPVTFVDNQPHTFFGRADEEICEEIFVEFPDAIDAVCAAHPFLIYDPEPGRNTMWPLLLLVVITTQYGNEGGQEQ